MRDSGIKLTLITENQLDLSSYKRVKMVYGHGLFVLVGVIEGEVNTAPISVWMTRANATAMLERLTARIEAGQLKPECEGQFEGPLVVPPDYSTKDYGVLQTELGDEQSANLRRDNEIACHFERLVLEK